MTVLFAFPGNEAVADILRTKGDFERGEITVHSFPDGETLVKLDTAVAGKDVLLLCTLDRPDEKATALMFFAKTAKELGAKSVRLIAPYLGYMRQDKRFHDGEAITSNIFAAFLSQHFDSLVTVDPHLHRHKNMNEIYTIPVTVLHATDAVAEWIMNNIDKPVLIGPDEESDQWVTEVAAKANAPYIVLLKTRRGDSEVEVSVPEISKYKDCTPILVDDIISTAHTMLETVQHVVKAGMKPPVCIGIHAVFAGKAWEALASSGAGAIITTNTISHLSNKIDVVPLLLS